MFRPFSRLSHPKLSVQFFTCSLRPSCPSRPLQPLQFLRSRTTFYRQPHGKYQPHKQQFSQPPYNRQQYRPEPPQYDPRTHSRIHVLIRGVIVANVIMLGSEYISLRPDPLHPFVLGANIKWVSWIYENLVLSMDAIKQHKYWTLVTSAFVHSGIIHLAFNMMAFQAFGSILGHVPGVTAGSMISLMVLGAAVSSGVALYDRMQETGSLRSHRNKDKDSFIGASGMVYALFGAACMLAPRVEVQVVFIPIRLGYLGALDLILETYLMTRGGPFALDQLFSGPSEGDKHEAPGSRIAHDAHLTGFVFGVLFYIMRYRSLGGMLAKTTL